MTTNGEREVSMPLQVFEPWSFENPGPEMPRMLSLKEYKRTGHIFADCPNPLPPGDTKGSNAPETCDVCARVRAAYRAEAEKWQALQEADARVWKVNGVPITGQGGAEPYPGMLPTQAHADALGWSGPVAEAPARPEIPAAPLPPQGDEPRATDKQVALLVRLACEKTPAWVNEVGLEQVQARAARLTRDEADARIKKLITQPTTGNKPTVRKETVPAGYYALPTVADGGNDLAFYRVDRPTSGKWAGYTFVKRIVGGQADENVPRNQSAGIIGRILTDTYAAPPTIITDDEGQTGTLPARDLTGPDAASMRYSDNAVRCRRCNIRLTKLASRIDGIGPVCATK